MKTISPRHKLLNELLLSKKGGPHQPLHKFVKRSKANKAFQTMLREYNIYCQVEER